MSALKIDTYTVISVDSQAARGVARVQDVRDWLAECDKAGVSDKHVLDDCVLSLMVCRGEL